MTLQTRIHAAAAKIRLIRWMQNADNLRTAAAGLAILATAILLTGITLGATWTART